MVVEFRCWVRRVLPDRLANADVCKVGDTSCGTNNETIGRGAAADDEREDAQTQRRGGDRRTEFKKYHAVIRKMAGSHVRVCGESLGLRVVFQCLDVWQVPDAVFFKRRSICGST